MDLEIIVLPFHKLILADHKLVVVPWQQDRLFEPDEGNDDGNGDGAGNDGGNAGIDYMMEDVQPTNLVSNTVFHRTMNPATFLSLANPFHITLMPDLQQVMVKIRAKSAGWDGPLY